MRNFILIILTFLISSITYAQEVDANKATNLYAQRFNVSLKEAQKRMAIMDQKNSITNKLIDKFGEDNIAGVYFVHKGEFKIVVRTTKKGRNYRDILNFASSEFSDLNVDVKSNSPRNFKAIENILKNQPKVLSKKIKGFQSIGYDPSEDKIVVSLYDPEIHTPEEAVSKYKIQKVAGMEVKFKLLAKPITLAALEGGVDIGCTSGFAAYGADKVTPGIITAYHCVQASNTHTLTDHLGNRHTLNNTRQPVSAYQDIAFLQATSRQTPLNPYVYYGNSSLPVEAVGNKSLLKIGKTFLCHSGISTGFSCGLVTETSKTLLSTANNSSGIQRKVCNTTGPYCYGFITISDMGLRCAPGDSGGPVTTGHTAYGIVSSCNLDKMSQGYTPEIYLSSLDYLYQFPVYLAIAKVDHNYYP